MSSTCRVSATSCTRYTCAPSHADTAVVASVPTSRSLTGRSSVSPTKSLLDSDTSTGHPVSTISSRRRVASRLCRVFLPKSCPGSMSTDSLGTPSATARSARPSVTRRMSAMTSSYVTRCGRVRGSAPPACVHTRPTPYRAATSASPGSTPPQASLSRSAPASQTASPTSARQVSTLMITSGKRRRTSATKPTVRRASSSAVTSSPGPAFTPPMSTMAAPSDTARSTRARAGSSWNVAPWS